jgi:uncharacterized membrane protein
MKCNQVYSVQLAQCSGQTHTFMGITIWAQVLVVRIFYLLDFEGEPESTIH